MHNPQDKSYWCKWGADMERRFVNDVAPYLNINAQINPEKRRNKYAPDLLVDGHLADLKYHECPFFLSNALYQVDNQYSVTFNCKDFERYARLYPDLLIFMWLHFVDTEMEVGGRRYRVRPLRGVWKAPFQRVAKLVSKAPVHAYKNRKDDRIGNARDSYVLDIRDFDCVAMRIS